MSVSVSVVISFRASVSIIIIISCITCITYYYYFELLQHVQQQYSPYGINNT